MRSAASICRGTYSFAVVLIAIIGFGCAQTPSANRSLRDSAHEWRECIAAQAVIPVLPLSADLKPGDMFVLGSIIDLSAILPFIGDEGRLDLRTRHMRIDAGAIPEKAPTSGDAAFPVLRFAVDARDDDRFVLPVGRGQISLDAAAGTDTTAIVRFTGATVTDWSAASAQEALHKTLESWPEVLPHSRVGELPILVEVVTTVYAATGLEVAIGSTKRSQVKATAQVEVGSVRPQASAEREDRFEAGAEVKVDRFNQPLAFGYRSILCTVHPDGRVLLVGNSMYRRGRPRPIFSHEDVPIATVWLAARSLDNKCDDAKDMLRTAMVAIRADYGLSYEAFADEWSPADAIICALYERLNVADSTQEQHVWMQAVRDLAGMLASVAAAPQPTEERTRMARLIDELHSYPPKANGSVGSTPEGNIIRRNTMRNTSFTPPPIHPLPASPPPHE